jgi:7-carboxy-7-deazaguanine synthase
MLDKLPVAETFGPTIQGEGNYAGKKVLFIRFSGCDFRCAWCDSKYTHVITKDTEWLSTDALLNRVKALNGEGVFGKGRKCDHIILTGGNPALYKLNDFIDGLHKMNIFVHIETQGTVFPDWLYKVDNVVFSPKGPSSKMKVDKKEVAGRINGFALTVSKQENKHVIIKIPIFDDLDYEWAKDFHTHLDMDLIDHYFLSVGNSNFKPTDTKDNIVSGLLDSYDWLVDKVMNDDYYQNISILPQIHTLLWGNKIGV